VNEERKALTEALWIVREMQAEQVGPRYPGRAHKFQTVHLPRLVEVLEDGLALNVPRVTVRTVFGGGFSWTHVVDECPHCGEEHRYWLTELEDGEKRVRADCGKGDLILVEVEE